MVQLYNHPIVKAENYFRKECEELLKPSIVIPKKTLKQRVKNRTVRTLKNIYHKIKK